MGEKQLEKNESSRNRLIKQYKNSRRGKREVVVVVVLEEMYWMKKEGDENRTGRQFRTSKSYLYRSHIQTGFGTSPRHNI